MAAATNSKLDLLCAGAREENLGIVLDQCSSSKELFLLENGRADAIESLRGKGSGGRGDLLAASSMESKV